MKLFARLLLILILMLVSIPGLKAQDSLVIRVGVVTYETFQDKDGELRSLLDQLSGSQNPPIRFQVATGSYREVAHWLQSDEIDVALLTAGGYVRGILQSNMADEFEYLATMDARPAIGPWVDENRRANEFQGFYQSVCLTHAQRSRLTLSQIKQASENGTLEVLLVHPQSASGALVPLKVLRDQGIELPANAVRYMHSHTQVLEALAQSRDGKTAIGFVWDDAISKQPELESELAMIQIPGLAEVQIPHDVLVARRDFVHLPDFKRILERQVFSQSRPLFLPSASGVQDYQDLQQRLELHAPSQTDLLVRQDLRGVGQLLAHAQKNSGKDKPFRLGVVLSGGGARCAYQVGVIGEVEKYLQELNGLYGSELDIDLVVGTSGGALNAVPVSMKVTDYANGQQVLRDVWESLDQREIILPSVTVRVNAGIWFAFLQMALIYFFGRLVRRRYDSRLRFFYRACLCLGAIEFVLCVLPFEPWGLLGHNHLLHHLWLWCRLGAEFTAIAMLFAGAIYYFVSRVAVDPDRQELKIRRGRIHWVLTVGVLGLPLLQLITMLMNEKTFSTGEGIRTALARGYTSMLEQHAEHHDMDYRVDSKVVIQKRLEAMGSWIVQNNAIRRDLVLTTTAIDRSRPEVPSELYFYLQANQDGIKPEFGNRGIDMKKSPSQFMNIVLGSSAIYPAFPGQVVEGLPQSGDRLELVDGGFAHNAPVEAAVLWGATHVLLVDVSPIATRDGVNLADSVVRGFGHLLRQSQLSDERSRSEIVVVNLQPRFEPPLCIIDFSSNLIKRGIEFGAADAVAETRLERHDDVLVKLPPFSVSYGRPGFLEIVAPVRTGSLHEKGEEHRELSQPDSTSFQRPNSP
ncbi:MAG: hypothetical protein CMJ82_11280 [Planctomycetaceae bacterium]|nr:hypothetical protein [Planctomycetaceae bacterium]|tara:strand:+ start:2282 stop:4858 length:2577 start_codon:yes stop_codon:yes gene_type:complete